MSRWWRAYDEAVDDAKLILLSDKQHRAWFGLMCIASACGGWLPEIQVIAIKLRMSPARAGMIITELKAAGLLDEVEGRFKPHNWEGRQYKSDVTDATAAERMRNYRNRKRNADRNADRNDAVTVTVPRDRVTETERKKEEDAPNGAPSKYVFESGVIRLNERDLNAWKAAYSHLDVPAELMGLSEWAGGQRSWFNAVKGALTKRNREVGIAKSRNGLDIGRGIV